jgi:hypothetical protein
MLTCTLIALALLNVSLAAEAPTVPNSAIIAGVDLSAHSGMPLWTTTSRLLKLGETLDFRFRIPSGAADGGLRVYPRYLEQADPGTEFNAGGELKWLARLPSEQVPLAFADGQAAVTYKPKQTGSYLAQWRVGNEAYQEIQGGLHPIH